MMSNHWAVTANTSVLHNPRSRSFGDGASLNIVRRQQLGTMGLGGILKLPDLDEMREAAEERSEPY
jgi:hypothetical protein